MGVKLVDSPLGGGAAPLHTLNNAGTLNPTLVKAGATQLLAIEVWNASAAVRYLKLYNKATAPTVGTDTPVLTIGIAAGNSRGITYVNGADFPLGLGYGTTLLPAASDTSVITVGDIYGSINYF